MRKKLFAAVFIAWSLVNFLHYCSGIISSGYVSPLLDRLSPLL